MAPRYLSSASPRRTACAPASARVRTSNLRRIAATWCLKTSSVASSAQWTSSRTKTGSGSSAQLARKRSQLRPLALARGRAQPLTQSFVERLRRVVGYMISVRRISVRFIALRVCVLLALTLVHRSDFVSSACAGKRGLNCSDWPRGMLSDCHWRALKCFARKTICPMWCA